MRRKKMISINNVQPLNPEDLFTLLKTDFPAYINEKLGSNVTVEFAHVADIINISFPEIMEGNAYTITVSEAELSLSNHSTEETHQATLLEQHLVKFLQLKAG